MQPSAHPPQPPMRSSRAAQTTGRKNRPCRPFSQDKEALAQSDDALMFRALLADDNELFRGFLRDVLVRHFPFMLIAEAGNGDHALALEAELHPQLVFMDIKLPDRSGLDLTKHLKSSNPGVLIYLVTQDDIPEYRAAAHECGADHVIVMGESSEAAIVAMVEATLSAHLHMSQMEGDEHMRAQEEYTPALPG
jgi:DNA-binding NarL/FixJ family response regulator